MLKPLPEHAEQTKNETDMVQMKSLKKELKFITDGNGLNNSDLKKNHLMVICRLKTYIGNKLD